MKHLLISIFTFSFIFIAQVSKASDFNLDPVPHMLKATVVSVQIDPTAEFFSPDFVSGLLEINFASQKLKLSLNKKMNCRGQFCLAVMPAPTDLEFHLTDYAVDDCNVVTYVAENISHDNGYQVTVVDSQQNKCHTPAVVSFSTDISIVTNGLTQKKTSRSKLGGRTLVSIQ